MQAYDLRFCDLRDPGRRRSGCRVAGGRQTFKRASTLDGRIERFAKYAATTVLRFNSCYRRVKNGGGAYRSLARAALYPLDENDRLRAGDFEPFAAARVLAGEHVVDAHEIVARSFESEAVLFIGTARRRRFSSATQPTYVILRGLAAVRAGEGRALYLLPFVEEITFLHSDSDRLGDAPRAIL